MQTLFLKIGALAAAVFMIPLTSTAQKLPRRKIFLKEELVEISGLTQTQRGDSTFFWAHNDGQNPAEIFKLNSKLKVVEKISHPRWINRDWEAITSDPAGNLYLGDFGNNLNSRRDLRIYIFNPTTRALDSILFEYPDQQQFPPPAGNRNFDCEAMVWHRDSLHLFSKNRFLSNFYCKHYSLPTRAGRAVAQLRDSIFLKKQVVTDAAVSPDGRTLLLTSYFFEKKMGFFPKSRAVVWRFEGFSGSAFFAGKLSRRRLRQFLLARQVEAVCFFSGSRILLGNERMAFNRAALRLLRD